jgi:hypothetical protein
MNTLYNLFNVDDKSSPYDIETAGKSALRTINAATIKQFLNNNNVDFSDEDIKNLILNMKKYIDSSASVLLEPSTRELYDSLIESKTMSVSHQSLMKARIEYMNANCTSVKFDPSVFEYIPKAENLSVVPNLTTQSKLPLLKCRWCVHSFKLDDFSILQCKCTARIGHNVCAHKFETEYKFKCPVCRGKLLKRREISKYMFWCVESKFKM